MLAQLKHLFIPGYSNNHRSRLLHPAGLALLIAIFLFSNASIQLFAATDNSLVRGTVLGYASDISVSQVVSLTNQERAGAGMAPLTFNPVLSTAAGTKAGDMFAFGYWAHNNPQTGRQPWDFIREAGYTYRYAGENLARDFGETQSMMSAWMASPSHRDNIISPRYSEIGVAVVDGVFQGVETTLVVQMFGAPIAGQAQVLDSPPTLGQTQALTQAEEPLEETEPAKDIVIVSRAQASEGRESENVIPPLAISKAISMSVLLLLSVTLIIDYLVVRKRRTVRVSGKNLAHLIFIGILIIVVIISAPGGIL